MIAEMKELLIKTGADYVLIDNGNLSVDVRNLYARGVNRVLELIGTTTIKDSLRRVSQAGTVGMSGMFAEQWLITDFAPMDIFMQRTSYYLRQWDKPN
jgi:NADPH:quinone reductase-like Zn-dependent oxidoreductase